MESNEEYMAKTFTEEVLDWCNRIAAQHAPIADANWDMPRILASDITIAN